MKKTIEKFTKADMVKFGEYLLSKKRKERLKDNPTSVPYKERKDSVYDADFANWEDDNNRGVNGTAN